MSRSHRFEIRVYYEDTDFSGAVYHAAYLHFFERGRTEFLRAEGIHHSELAKDGVAFAVRSMEIEFPRAARWMISWSSTRRWSRFRERGSRSTSRSNGGTN